MSKKIYNKNAREKALLEEAYGTVNEAGPLLAAAGRALAPAAKQIGTAAVTGAAAGAHDRARGMVAGDEEHPAQRAAESIIGAEVMWDGMMKRGQVEEVDVENGVAVVYDEDGGEHIVELGDFDVVLPVEDNEGWGSILTGAAISSLLGRGAIPGGLAGAAYDALKEKKPKKKKEEDAESREERADVDKYEYEQGKEAGEREDHDKGVKMAHEALEMFKDELHVGGHGEDINVNELADAHDQLSRALHWLLDETDVEYITGGRATQKAEAEVDFKPAYGEY